jgi:hypothetical protein
VDVGVVEEALDGCALGPEGIEAKDGTGAAADVEEEVHQGSA